MRLDEGHYDVLIPAVSGLHRVDQAHRITETLSLETMCPPIGAGIIALQCRAEDVVRPRFGSEWHSVGRSEPPFGSEWRRAGQGWRGQRGGAAPRFMDHVVPPRRPSWMGSGGRWW